MTSKSPRWIPPGSGALAPDSQPKQAVEARIVSIGTSGDGREPRLDAFGWAGAVGDAWLLEGSDAHFLLQEPNANRPIGALSLAKPTMVDRRAQPGLSVRDMRTEKPSRICVTGRAAGDLCLTVRSTETETPYAHYANRGEEIEFETPQLQGEVVSRVMV